MELEEESTFDPVEKLQQLGINASDIQKLKDGGYYTIGMILKTPRTKNWKSIDNDYPDAYFVQLGQIENGANERAVNCNVKTAFSFTPSSILT